MPATALDECNAVVDRLYQARGRWAALSTGQRCQLLRKCIEGMLSVSDGWVAAACKAKGLERGGGGEGEEWLGGVMPVVRNLRLLIHALEHQGQPKPPKVWRRSNDQHVARIFPTSVMDKALFTGFDGEIWIEPGKAPTQGAIYRNKATNGPGDGCVSLVLGAGNQASIGPMDALYKLFVEDEVVVLKMNPVNEYLGPYIARAFKVLVDQDFLAVVYGGAEVGAHLCQHEQVGSIHITGSARTHDAIVWGAVDEATQAKRKASGQKVLDKPITSELGCVTPIMLVPGAWSESEMDYQARQVVSMVSQNGSFNCNAGKVLVLASGWDRREAFLGKLRQAFRRSPPRKAYYPGAQDRYQRFLDHYPKAEVLGERSDEVVPWTILPDVPAEADQYALTHEAFCGVLAIVTIEAKDAGQYLEVAPRFCNDQIWGTLSCNLIIDPATQKAHKEAYDAAIADLRYGAIGVNAWSGVVYGLVSPTWGAFPGHPLEDIRSGRGVVHNTFLFDHPQKSVVKTPFIVKPTPAWFVDHKNLAQLGARLSRFEASPSWGQLPAVAMAALKG